MRPRSAIAAVLAAAALVLVAASPQTTRPASEATSELPPEQLAHAQKPISYFNASCSSCHGDYGNFWGEGFAADKSDEELREVVEEMCDGPAQSPLEGRALAAQVAYNRSLKTRSPFATAYAGGDGKLGGEVTPESTVTLVTGGKEVKASVDGHVWTSDAKTASAVRVEKGGKTVTLDLAGGENVAFPDAK